MICFKHSEITIWKALRNSGSSCSWIPCDATLGNDREICTLKALEAIVFVEGDRLTDIWEAEHDRVPCHT